MTGVVKESDGLLARAAAGDARAWGDLLTAHDARLRRVIAFRLDPRLSGRVDAGDVVQEVYLEAVACRANYFGRAAADGVPLFIWLRGVAANKLLEVHRRHLGTKLRDAGRERGLYGGGGGGTGGEATVDAVVAQVTVSATGPRTVAERSEAAGRVRAALDEMEPIDREVLALRHYEQLTNTEAARVLGIQERAGAKRYLRALKRLKDVLAGMPGGLTELRP
jgi:RNA polymerase sigma-70 factor (ECF subfamily)